LITALVVLSLTHKLEDYTESHAHVHLHSHSHSSGSHASISSTSADSDQMNQAKTTTTSTVNDTNTKPESSEPESKKKKYLQLLMIMVVHNLPEGMSFAIVVAHSPLKTMRRVKNIVNHEIGMSLNICALNHEDTAASVYMLLTNSLAFVIGY